MSSVADTASPSAAARKGGRFGIGMLLGVALFSVAGAGGAAYFVLGKSKADAAHGEAAQGDTHASGDQAEPPSPASYLGLDPAFVVNLESPDEPRYLQAEVQLMARDAHALDGAKLHVPRIRNSLLMLFGQQKPADLSTRTGKEKLQQAALAEVRHVLQAETGKPVVEAVYFTSFVMQ